MYEQVYCNGNYYERGLLESETLSDGSGKVITSTLNTHELVNSRDPQAAVILTGHDSLTGTVFSRLVRTREQWHDANGVAKSTEMIYEYDPRGNLFRMTDTGEPDLPNDDVVSEMRFTQCDAPVAQGGEPGGNPEFPWTQMPDIMIVRSGTTVLQRREALVECNTASVAEVRDYLAPDGQDPAQVQVTTVKYLPVGGQTSAIIGPGPRQDPDPNEDVVQLDKNNRYGVVYEWDEVGAFPTRTTDSYGTETTTKWDDRMGRLLSKTEPNNSTTTYSYDNRGRLKEVRGPWNRPVLRPSSTRTTPTPPTTTRGCSPRNIDVAKGTTINTALFVDGLGREIQTKQHGSVGGAPQVIVDGAVDYDAFGRSWPSTTRPPSRSARRSVSSTARATRSSRRGSRTRCATGWRR